MTLLKETSNVFINVVVVMSSKSNNIICNLFTMGMHYSNNQRIKLLIKLKWVFPKDKQLTLSFIKESRLREVYKAPNWEILIDYYNSFYSWQNIFFENSKRKQIIAYSLNQMTITIFNWFKRLPKPRNVLNLFWISLFRKCKLNLFKLTVLVGS